MDYDPAPFSALDDFMLYDSAPFSALGIMIMILILFYLWMIDKMVAHIGANLNDTTMQSMGKIK